MSRGAEVGHGGRSGALARRARLGPLSLALLAVVALLVPALAEASVPRSGALERGDVVRVAFASLGQGAPAGASRDAASLRPLGHELAPLALAVPETDSGFALFAGDELARALDQAGDTGSSRFALELGGEDLALAPLALASRVRDGGFHPLHGLALIDTEPLRGPPELDEDLRRRLDIGGAHSLPGLELLAPETRIGASGVFLGTRIGGEARLTLSLQWVCDLSGCEIAEDQRKDPLGLESPKSQAVREKFQREMRRQQDECPCIGSAPTDAERAEGQQGWAAYRAYVDEKLFWVKATVVVPNAVAAVLAAKTGMTARSNNQVAAARLPEAIPPRISAPANAAPVLTPRPPAPLSLYSDLKAPELSGTSRGTADPRSINFSQRTVDENVEAYTNDMKAGKWDWNRSGPVRVTDVNGQLETYDNRRVMAAQNAGLSEIPIEVVNPADVLPVPGAKKTWSKAFEMRRNSKLNKQYGGAVPPGGVSQQPTVLQTTVKVESP